MMRCACLLRYILVFICQFSKIIIIIITTIIIIIMSEFQRHIFSDRAKFPYDGQLLFSVAIFFKYSAFFFIAFNHTWVVAQQGIWRALASCLLSCSPWRLFLALNLLFCVLVICLGYKLTHTYFSVTATLLNKLTCNGFYHFALNRYCKLSIPYSKLITPFQICDYQLLLIQS